MTEPVPRALIAEDEPLLALALQQLLGQLWPQLQIEARVADGISAVQQALTRLLAGQPTVTDGELTVSNLCREAGVGRDSFYRSPPEFKDAVVAAQANREAQQPELVALREEITALKRERKQTASDHAATVRELEETIRVYANQIQVLALPAQRGGDRAQRRVDLLGLDRVEHLGEVLAVGVDGAGHETGLGAERQRDRVERVVHRTDRSRLGHLAGLGGRRVLALGQPVDAVVEQHDGDVHVAPQGVDQVIAAGLDEPELHVDEPYVLLTPTYGGGTIGKAVPVQVKRFLNDERNRSGIIGVIASGNTNFGEAYGIAGDIIAAKCRVPLLYRFELMGTPEDTTAVREGLHRFFDEYTQQEQR